MPIQEAFYIKTIDRVVTVGVVAEGSVKPGDKLFVRSRLGSFPIVVESIDKPLEKLSGVPQAEAGQGVGLMLDGISKDQVQADDAVLAESMINPEKVKRDSERIILRAGGKICDWLPPLEPSDPRGADEIIGRALVMNALFNIYLKAPIPVIKKWIVENGVEGHLSDWERGILAKSNDQLSEQELTNLGWCVEGLWALMWVGSLIDELDFCKPVEDDMATLVPDLQQNEAGSKFSEKMRIRPHWELFWMLDLYYRVHWYARDGQINGYSTGNVSVGIAMERRKALEWVMDSSSDWDDIDLST
jgi:hypothetical protein